MIYELLSSCVFGASATILHIAEKCTAIKRAHGLVKSCRNEKALEFLRGAGQLLSPAEVFALRTVLPPAEFLDVVQRLPLNKRGLCLSLDFLKTLLGMLVECKELTSSDILANQFAQTLISVVAHRDTLLSCQIHSVCCRTTMTPISEIIPYECGYLCATCSQSHDKPVAVCIICAHRCHQGHVLQPLGVQEFACNCASVGACNAVVPLPLPLHIKLHEKFSAQTDMLFRYDPAVLREDGRDVGYVSKECITGTLVGTKPMCAVGPEFSEEMGEASLTVGYYEVEVLLGGTYDQIAVGLTTDENYPIDEFAGYKDVSVAYHGDDGKCYIGGQAITYGCRFGSYDIVGCGITQAGDVYFTFNGMLLPLINLQLEGSVYPVISLRGKFTSVRINMGPNCDFEHGRLLELPVPTGIVVANAELVQYLAESTGLYDKLGAICGSKGVSPGSSAIIRAMLGEEPRFKTKGIHLHKHQSSLFSTKVSNPEENKADSLVPRGDMQHGHFSSVNSNVPGTATATDRGKGDHCKNWNESEGYDEFTNANTHNDMRPFEGTARREEAAGEKGRTSQISNNNNANNSSCQSAPKSVTRPAVERIGDLPPMVSAKKSETKDEIPRKSCGCGRSGCLIF